MSRFSMSASDPDYELLQALNAMGAHGQLRASSRELADGPDRGMDCSRATAITAMTQGNGSGHRPRRIPAAQPFKCKQQAS